MDTREADIKRLLAQSLYAPSLPNSMVQSEFLFRSSPLTVGREALIALTKSLTLSGGSRS